MAFEDLLAKKQAFIFGLDNVIYPEKDYYLQVYYLFSGFMEYTELYEAKTMLSFMQQLYSTSGREEMFEKTAEKFAIDLKYKENFDQLHETAKLPLKLLLYAQVLAFMQEIIIERKAVYLLVPDNPGMQLNKIRQMEWHGMESYLKVYFAEESAPFPSIENLGFLFNGSQYHTKDVLYIGNTDDEQYLAEMAGVDFLPASKLL